MSRKINDFLKIKNLSEHKAELWFTGEIVSDEWSKWMDSDKCPQDVIDYLATINDYDELDIYINSGGGSLFSGIGIYNILSRHKGHKTVYVDGLAGSIASVIAMVGDEIICPSNSFLMIHRPLVGIEGNAIDLRIMADTLDRLQEGIINTYKTKLKDGIDIETIINMVETETWLTGEQASQYFNITLVDPNKAVAKVDINSIKNYSNVPKELLEYKNVNSKTYAIDFDGVLFKDGQLKEDIVNKLISLKNEGNKLLLWTCRQGNALKDALDMIAKQDLTFDNIDDGNYNDVSKKIYADYYIDDRNISIEDFLQDKFISNRINKIDLLNKEIDLALALA